MADLMTDPFGFLLMLLPLLIIVYIIVGACLYKLAKRTNTSHPILGFIPVGNVYLISKLAQKPIWWFVVMLIVPIADIVLAILSFVAISKRMGRPGWWGVVISLIPIVNIILLVVLAFGKSNSPGVK